MIPCFKSSGKDTNNVSEGKTSQKTLVANELTLETSLVSIYNQNIANTETNGTEANSAPYNELRLAISAMATISTVVIKILKI